MPLIASLLDGFLNHVEEQYQTLTEAKDQPHVLDDYTVVSLWSILLNWTTSGYSTRISPDWMTSITSAR